MSSTTFNVSVQRQSTGKEATISLAFGNQTYKYKAHYYTKLKALIMRILFKTIGFRDRDSGKITYVKRSEIYKQDKIFPAPLLFDLVFRSAFKKASPIVLLKKEEPLGSIIAQYPVFGVSSSQDYFLIINEMLNNNMALDKDELAGKKPWNYFKEFYNCSSDAQLRKAFQLAVRERCDKEYKKRTARFKAIYGRAEHSDNVLIHHILIQLKLNVKDLKPTP